MAVDNPSFETPAIAPPGAAENWDEVYSSSAESIVDFTHYDGYTRPWELFNQSWLDNHLFQLVFTLTDLFATTFSGGALEESFEFQWKLPNTPSAAPFNNSALFSFGSEDISALEFDAANDEVEDFEEEWDDNEDFELAFPSFGSGVLAAASLFDSGADSYEDFEGSWNNNDTAHLVNTFFTLPGVTLTVAMFDPTGAGDLYEDFDTWTTVLP